jgi:monoterpene epsilon-lactone hydrolase
MRRCDSQRAADAFLLGGSGGNRRDDVDEGLCRPTVQRAGILDMTGLYLNGADPCAPLAVPIYADPTGLAPLLIQVAAAETLLDDAIRLAKVGGATDVRVDLQIWPEMIHVWHLFHPELKAGRRAIEEGASFVRAMIVG